MFNFPKTLFYEILNDAIEKSNLPLNNKNYLTGSFCFFTCKQEKRISSFNNHISNNIFMDEDFKDTCLTYFSIAQNRFKGLKKIARIYKNSKLPFKNKQDLILEEISNVKPSLKMTLIENNSKYCFRIADIICIINNALLFSSSNFYSEPTHIKNPYTNVPFLEHTLYNIYFNIKNSTFLMPVLFHLFMQSEFNLKEFTNNNEPLLRDILIKRYIDSLTNKTYIKEIKNMFKDSNVIGVTSSKKLKEISPKMPADIMVKVFKPFIDTYLYAIYTLNYTKKFEKRQLLYKKVTGFLNENPQFGRKIMRSKQTKRDLFVFGALPYSSCGFNIDVKNTFTNINIENVSAFQENNTSTLLTYINHPAITLRSGTQSYQEDATFVLNGVGDGTSENPINIVDNEPNMLGNDDSTANDSNANNLETESFSDEDDDDDDEESL